MKILPAAAVLILIAAGSGSAVQADDGPDLGAAFGSLQGNVQAAKDRQVLTRMAACLSARQAQVSGQEAPSTPRAFPDCSDATVAAADAEEFALEDRKMFPSDTDGKGGCTRNRKAGTVKDPISSDPTDYPYVHLDAIPFATVTGDEDPKAWTLRTAWSFAWETAAQYKTLDRDHILLAANPRFKRSQDQLHIHLVRITDEDKARLLSPERDSAPDKRVPPAYVDQLSDVWDAARKNAADLGKKLGIDGGLDSAAYGIAVTYDPAKGQYAVVAINDSPEQDYAVLCAAWTP